MSVMEAVAGPRQGYRVGQVMRAEFEKLRTLRSTVWMLLISVVGAGLVTFLVTNAALHHGPDWYQGFDATQESLVGLLVPALVLAVLGALVVTGEYSSGSIRVSLSATPRRPVFLIAKLAVAAVGLLVFSEILSFGCFFLGQAILSGGGAPSAHLTQPGVLRAVLESGAGVAMLALLSFGLGLIFRSTAGALGGYAGVAFVLPLILKTMSGHVDKYAPSMILTNSLMATANNNPGAWLSPTLGLLLMALYTSAALIAGTVLFLRRDA